MLQASVDKLHSLVEAANETISEETSDETQAGVAMLVVEVKDPDTSLTVFYTFCTDKREWIQRALLDEAKMAVDFSEAEVSDGD